MELITYKVSARCFSIVKMFLPIVLCIIIVAPLQSLAEPKSHNKQIEPQVVKRALPIYPKYAIKNKIEGAVLLNFSIERDGNVSDIEVVAADHDGLFDATAILGLQKWAYTKSNHKVRNNYVAIEFVLSENPTTSKFSNVEIIQVRPQ